MKKLKTKLKLNTPSILQIEAAECGAASLGIILGYYGNYLSLESLREDCGVSKDGSKASNILKAARKNGLEAKGYKKEPAEIKTLDFPLIVHWNFNHFLVVEGYDKKYFYLNDPALGKRKVLTEEFDLSFTGIVLSFKEGENFQKNRAGNSIFFQILKSLKKYNDVIIFLFIIGILVTIPGIVLPVFTKIFIDEIILNQSSNWLAPVLAGIFATALFKAVFLFLQEQYTLKLEHKISLVNSAKFFQHILKLPINYFYQRFAGEISQVMELNDEYSKIIIGKLITVLINLLFFIFYIAIMISFSFKLTVIAVVVTVVNFIILYLISKSRNIMNQKLTLNEGKLYGISISGIQMIETLKSTGRESDFFSKWSGYHSKLISSSNKINLLNEISFIIPQFFYMIGLILILSVGAFETIRGVISIGTLISFQAMFCNFFEPVNSLMQLAGNFQEAVSYKHKIDDVLNNKLDDRFTNLTDKNIEQTIEGDIELKEVSFGYSKLEKPVIKTISLGISAGEQIGIIGKSGSGKSTIAKLISGLYQPWEGNIYYDTNSINSYSREFFSEYVSYVDQNIVIYEGTIAENIAMFNYSITQDKITEAAKLANIHEDIMKLKHGYDTILTENGRNISGGQRQRLEIARALLKNPSILILDEATSALDNIAESKIIRNISKLGITTIIIAQRFETLKNCNKLYVIEYGEVVESGNYDYLIENSNFVKELTQ